MQFSETKLGGTLDRIFHIHEPLVDDIVTIGREMNARGWILKIEDGFRTQAMQITLGRNPAIFDTIVAMCQWENGGAPPSPDLVFRRAKCLVAIWPRTGTHLLGAAVDISVFRRDDGSEVWRGGPYIEMSERTPMASPWVTAEEHANRMEITEHMERHGFMHYPGEFWHYNKGDALYQHLVGSGKPGIYGPVHWDPATGATTPWDDIDAPLTPPDVFAGLVEDALARLHR
jgi:D-alanyl-D-alanine dipeptidase